MSLHDIFRGDIIPLSGTKVSIGRNRFDPPAPFVPVEEVIQNTAVFVDIITSSGVLRFKGGVPAMELSLDRGKNFNNLLTLASGINGAVLFNDNNNIGQSSDLTLNKTLGILGVSGALELKYQPNSLPINNGKVVASGITQVTAYSLANRPSIGFTGSGTAIPVTLQPALWNTFAAMMIPSVGTTTTPSTRGITFTITNAGASITHPTPGPFSGVMMQLLCAPTTAASVQTSAAVFFRGAISGVNTGFFYATRITLPDVLYDNVRVFCGLSLSAITGVLATDDIPVDTIGFQFVSLRDAKNWQFAFRSGGPAVRQTTNMVCSGESVYDMHIYCPPFPNNETIFWSIRDMSKNQEISGFVPGNLPTKNIALLAGLGIKTNNAVSRSIRFTHIYCEAL